MRTHVRTMVGQNRDTLFRRWRPVALRATETVSHRPVNEMHPHGAFRHTRKCRSCRPTPSMPEPRPAQRQRPVCTPLRMATTPALRRAQAVVARDPEALALVVHRDEQTLAGGRVGEAAANPDADLAMGLEAEA